ncbi:MAG: DNA polymerase I [Oscillospiraceae bacterium]|jgi:DNA polymerase-1|nr:DNA polymerase I [Oscillospiraceae bacterium]
MVIDGNSIVYRAFYGVKPLNAPDGTPTNAVYGFIRILQKLIEDEKPDALLVAFDTAAPTFRHDMSEAYKATRQAMPDALSAQWPLIEETLDAMSLARVSAPGWEADDILGTASREASERGWNSVLVTGDRDSLQLISPSTRVLLVKTKGGNTETTDYTPDVFFAEYGFEPIKLVDLKALMGDPSDNIPGVYGVGEKTALDLVRSFGHIEKLYAQLDTADIKDALRAKLENGKESAFLSKTLATIRRDAPVALDFESLSVRPPDGARLYELFSRLGFRKLIEKMELAPGSSAAVNEGEAEDELAEPELPDGVDASKIVFGSKELLRENGEAEYIFDIPLAAYLVSPTDRRFDGETLSRRYLGRGWRDGDAARLYIALSERLREDGMEKLYYDVELPLCRVLADMEAEGVLVDREALREYGEMLAARLDRAQGRVYELAGSVFNIASPKQLGEVLFDRLGLYAPKKTKTGYSTAAEVLDQLEDKHPVIGAVKQYRELTKLKATYADGLIKVIAPDGRIHTSFQMTATATGRLSSTEPNLQNIPVRRELGAELRRMFIAPPGKLLVDADYSQIELRLLAHIAGDSAMTEAFRTGEDIHAVTAAKVFGVGLSEVTPLLRSRAKAVNFGIVYGISAFSLSKDVGVTIAEAKEYIDSYLERFSGVRAYMTDIVERAKRDGYVSTLFGRRRYIPELVSHDRNTRAFGERVALNTPIQGAAADIIKIAMVKTHARLLSEGGASKLILQVHDELIAEAPEKDAPRTAELLREEMERAASLSVPLTALVSVGQSWADCK